MTPDQAIEQARSGTLAPVYLLLGEERLLRNRVVDALKAASTEGAVPGFNEDEFTAGESPIGSIIAAARTLPMMAQKRWVLVRDVERLETKSSAGQDGKSKGDSPLDQLAAYAKDPSPTSTLVLCASKLNGKRRLVTLAKKQGFIVQCEPLARSALPRWLQAAAKRRGNTLNPSAADLIADVGGSDLATLDDIVERLSLYAGEGAEITEDDVGELIPIVRPATTWQLMDAIGRKDRGEVLGLLQKVYDPQDRGLRLLGALAWSARQMLRFEASLADGLRGADAAKAAGAPPFRARDLERQVRRFGRTNLEAWLVRLRDVDLALKGGSKLPPRAVLESALLELCGTPERR
jgi:DNA polymerase-3 subunit delta